MKQKQRTFLKVNLSNPQTIDRFRLLGYGVFALMALIVTSILVASAQGYDIDRDTGEIVQNGLVLVDASPNNANIYIDDEPKNDSTPGRYSLRAGSHSVRLQRDGYQEWSKQVQVRGSEVLWLYYPRLFPSVVSTKTVNNYKSVSQASQSPNKRWLLLITNKTKPAISRYDLSTPELVDAAFTIPQDILSKNAPAGTSTYNIIEWSQDSEQLLVKHTYRGGSEYLVISTERIADSYSLSARAGLALSDVHFKDDNNVLFYTNVSGNLRQLDGRDGSLSAPILKDVAFYEQAGDGRILFVEQKDASVKPRAGVYKGSVTNYLHTFAKTAKEYYLRLEAFDSVDYLLVGSSSQNNVVLYERPFTDSDVPAIPKLVLFNENIPQQISFSPNNQFIMSQSGKDIQVYDLDKDNLFKWSFTNNVAANADAKWLDGYHLAVFDAENIGRISEYDGQNMVTIGDGIGKYGAFFDRTSEFMISIDSSSTGTGLSMLRTDLLSDTDIN